MGRQAGRAPVGYNMVVRIDLRGGFFWHILERDNGLRARLVSLHEGF